jgi:ELWxxDGT repeat protein
MYQKYFLFLFLFLLNFTTEALAQSVTLVKDIYPGSGSSASARRSIVNGNTAYFPAENGKNGAELWKTDGTEAGTKIFKAATVSFDLATFNNRVFFITRDGFSENVWASDGTTAGTKSVAGGSPRDLTSSTLGVFFNDRNQLKLSDGTEAGTKTVTEIGTGFGLT